MSLTARNISSSIRILEPEPLVAIFRIPVDVLVFVEDQGAARLCRLLVERFDPSLARRMEIVPLNGDGSIINLLKEVENNYQSITILGLFDGDAKTAVPDEIRPKALFLPGGKPVELLFKELCESDPDGLRDISGWLNVSDSLFALQSRDHHDWFSEFAKSRGLEAGQLFMILFNFWLKAGNNEEEAKTAFDAIRKKIEQEGAKVEVSVLDESHLVAVLEVVETGR